MKQLVDKVDRYHDSRRGRIVFGAAELLASYIVISLALDNGSLLLWALGILLFIGSLRNLVSAARTNTGLNSGGKKRSKRR